MLKPVSEFRIRTRITPKPRSHCKSCESKNQQERAKKFPEKFNKRKRDWEVKNPKKYYIQKLKRSCKILGLESESNKILNLFETKNNCSICGHQPNENEIRLHIDHDHNTGLFRGLLCMECNLGLGKFKEDSELLIKASLYIKRNIPECATKDELL